MARRNIFQPPPPPAPTAGQETEAKPRFPNTGAMSGVKSTLKDLSSNAVREIDPQLIEEGGPRDRLAFSDADVAALAESIRTHGQQVPVMVRPMPDRPGHYRIVYGRRRLRALRALGIPAKALVRSLSEEQAILAQGQENSQRLDPSFIEKALFTAELVQSGYDSAIILDALAIDKPMLSRMNKVARSIPAEVISAIGPAHGIGRRRWEDLADLTRDDALDLNMVLADQDESFAGLESDARFARIFEAASKALAAPALPGAPAVSLQVDGVQLAELKDSPRALTLRFNRADAPGFADWLRDNAEIEITELFERWKTSAGQN